MSRFLLLVVLAALVLWGCTTRKPSGTRELKIGTVPLNVEVADTVLSRAQGLSGRDKLTDGTGMLFVFSEPSRYDFWMKDMKFALDFLWLRGGVITEISTNVPPPITGQPVPARLRPQEPADAIIEVPAGWVAEHGVTTGTKVQGLP